ncbi:hypothetical protein [Candidatus Amarolinea dominans]|uniref:hypothetical protein n=1 Tax=Candidatus Amarolinea dominans TaxID=3140696 RepID=UPI00313551E9|nr:hypothetical protein [Anaerolineae bacterium]
MCGIAGVCRSDQQPVAQAQLEQMAHLLRHRGPDDQGIYQNGPTGLAFRRLAILDLSPAGHQPMTNEDGTLWLVFNGEIYNYRSLVSELEAAGHIFRSRSDSEAILHAYEQWGDDCVLHFDGMFAFALWDEARQRLFAPRPLRHQALLLPYQHGALHLCFGDQGAAGRPGHAPPAQR